jgi:nitrogen fixation NifU-like protein
MSEDALNELYQTILLKHSKTPLYYGKLEYFTHKGEGFNPICGDALTIYLNIEGSTLKALSFESAACAICKASASVMLEQIQLISLAEVDDYKAAFNQLLSQEDYRASLPMAEDFKAFKGILKFPARKTCAMLPWDTLEKALDSA